MLKRSTSAIRGFTFVLLATAALIGLTTGAPTAAAQVGVDVNIGPPPDCPYGYHDVPPYGCAAAGYYGPEWFNGGVFIGAGPWFHGDNEFRGHVNNRFHPDHGYRGPMPKPGERADESKRVDSRHFKGNEVRDGRGHTVKEKR
jgi:hypothetical protein